MYFTHFDLTTNFGFFPNGIGDCAAACFLCRGTIQSCRAAGKSVIGSPSSAIPKVKERAGRRDLDRTSS